MDLKLVSAKTTVVQPKEPAIITITWDKDGNPVFSITGDMNPYMWLGAIAVVHDYLVGCVLAETDITPPEGETA